MVSLHPGPRDGAEPLDTLFRLGAEVEGVAQEEDGVVCRRVDQHGLEGAQVAVDVRDHQVAHRRTYLLIPGGAVSVNEVTFFLPIAQPRSLAPARRSAAA